jgi:hypothetical protein
MSWEAYYIILLIVAILLTIIAVVRLYIWCAAVDRADRIAAERAVAAERARLVPQPAPQYGRPPPQYSIAVAHP